jgi:prepilin-type N-terminal cleavage/methylation domain-containing protein/prepilin-type processing-associated H-X9-DG protein
MLPRANKLPGAFTLVELLVVVSIIGILCAVMVPAVGHARTRAKKVACGAVLHGLAVGMKAYLSEYGERYPSAAEMPSVNVGFPALPVALKSEVAASGTTGEPGRAWRCPGDLVGYVRTSDHQSFDSYFAGETLSFEYNMSLGGKRVEQDFLYPLLGSSGILVLADFDGFHGPQGLPTSKNLLFADGHVGGIDDIQIGK